VTSFMAYKELVNMCAIVICFAFVSYFSQVYSLVFPDKVPQQEGALGHSKQPQ